ncbi:hypothetical protein DFH06DRAFT_1338218 [Mycena polygramma]|nr:hypothetical protein DFH06DRAFT_1338218 [Mycena polygramma]
MGILRVPHLPQRRLLKRIESAGSTTAPYRHRRQRRFSVKTTLVHSPLCHRASSEPAPGPPRQLARPHLPQQQPLKRIESAGSAIAIAVGAVVYSANATAFSRWVLRLDVDGDSLLQHVFFARARRVDALEPARSTTAPSVGVFTALSQFLLRVDGGVLLGRFSFARVRRVDEESSLQRLLLFGATSSAMRSGVHAPAPQRRWVREAHLGTEHGRGTNMAGETKRPVVSARREGEADYGIGVEVKLVRRTQCDRGDTKRLRVDWRRWAARRSGVASTIGGTAICAPHDHARPPPQPSAFSKVQTRSPHTCLPARESVQDGGGAVPVGGGKTRRRRTIEEVPIWPTVWEDARELDSALAGRGRGRECVLGIGVDLQRGGLCIVADKHSRLFAKEKSKA